jgi:hypothetical protein
MKTKVTNPKKSALLLSSVLLAFALVAPALVPTVEAKPTRPRIRGNERNAETARTERPSRRANREAKRTGDEQVRVIESVLESEGKVVVTFRDGTSMTVPATSMRVREGRRGDKRAISSSASLSPGQKVVVKVRNKDGNEVVKFRVQRERPERGQRARVR